MRTVEINYYTYKELSKEAQQTAIDNNRDWNVDHDWWSCSYDDAERLGVTISGFDTGRSNYIHIALDWTVGDTVQAILKDHGNMCDTYKLAQEYYRRKHIKSPMDVDEFTKLLGECYLQMLNKEFDYLTEDEQIAESLECNEMEFLENGQAA